MAESSKTPKAKRRGGRYCVAGTPNQQSCKNTSFTPGIRMHQFPSDPSVRGFGKVTNTAVLDKDR